MELWANEDERLSGRNVNGHHCVCFCVSRFQTFDGVAYEQHKMHLGFKHCIKSAKPLLSDKPQFFSRVLRSLCPNVG